MLEYNRIPMMDNDYFDIEKFFLDQKEACKYRDSLAHSDMIRILDNLVERIKDQRIRFIIKERRRGRTLKDIGSELGISLQRVQQLQKKGINQIKDLVQKSRY